MPRLTDNQQSRRSYLVTARKQRGRRLFITLSSGSEDSDSSIEVVSCDPITIPSSDDEESRSPSPKRRKRVPKRAGTPGPTAIRANAPINVPDASDFDDFPDISGSDQGDLSDMSLGDDDDELPLENEVSRIVEDSSKLLMKVRESVDWKAAERAIVPKRSGGYGSLAAGTAARRTIRRQNKEEGAHLR
jgi:hypothetical protein